MRREPPGAPAHFCLKARQLFSYWSGRRGAQIGEMRVWRGWARFFTKKHGNYSKVRPPTLPNTAVIEKNQKNQKKEGGGNYRSDARESSGELRGTRVSSRGARGTPGGSGGLPNRSGELQGPPKPLRGHPGASQTAPGASGVLPNRSGIHREAPGAPRCAASLPRASPGPPELPWASPGIAPVVSPPSFF